MTVRLNPYISFKTEARPALELYQSVLGGQLSVNTFAEFGVSDAPAEKDLLMHGLLEAENGMVIMAADTPSSMEYVAPAGISISLSGEDEATLRRYWDGLTVGASVATPLEKAPWGDTFGMFTDRFGIGWMVNITAS